MSKISGPGKPFDEEKLEQSKKSGPSGATEKLKEREEKFDEEGGDQPQAASEREAGEALEKIDQSTGSEFLEDDPATVSKRKLKP